MARQDRATQRPARIVPGQTGTGPGHAGLTIQWHEYGSTLDSSHLLLTYSHCFTRRVPGQPRPRRAGPGRAAQWHEYGSTLDSSLLLLTYSYWTELVNRKTTWAKPNNNHSKEDGTLTRAAPH